MPPTPKKTFNIPFSGEAATVVCLIKYTSKYDDTPTVYNSNISAQYNADGTIVTFFGSIDASLSVSVNNGVMTVTLNYGITNPITDCRCCLIPGVPFA